MIGIGSTGFDGAKEGPLFNDVRPDLQDFFTRSGRRSASGWSSPSWSACWSRSALVGALWWLGTEGMPRAGPAAWTARR